MVVLPPAPDLKGKGVRANWNATALAFLGDSVWEVCNISLRRKLLCWPRLSKVNFTAVCFTDITTTSYNCAIMLCTCQALRFTGFKTQYDK